MRDCTCGHKGWQIGGAQLCHLSYKETGDMLALVVMQLQCPSCGLKAPAAFKFEGPNDTRKEVARVVHHWARADVESMLLEEGIVCPSQP